MAVRRRPRSLLDRALQAKRESKYVDFKESFDPSQSGEWCELIKDIVAMANSGGGVILVGVRNDGTRSRWAPSTLLRIDPAEFTNKIARYTGEQFADFEVHEVERRRARIGAIEIRATPIPLVFTKPGTYDIGGGKQKTAFAQGTVYFRHGAKSEPANSKDLRDFLDRGIERVRRAWLGNIRKVAEAPPGSIVSVADPSAGSVKGHAGMPVRIVTDPAAPGYNPIQYDITHPHRQKEVVRLVNERLGGGVQINAFDIQCVRKTHGVDSQSEHCYKPKFSTAQYSDAFVDWLVAEHAADTAFFEKARDAYRRQAKG